MEGRLDSMDDSEALFQSKWTIFPEDRKTKDGRWCVLPWSLLFRFLEEDSNDGRLVPQILWTPRPRPRCPALAVAEPSAAATKRSRRARSRSSRRDAEGFSGVRVLGNKKNTESKNVFLGGFDPTRTLQGMSNGLLHTTYRLPLGTP